MPNKKRKTIIEEDVDGDPSIDPGLTQEDEDSIDALDRFSSQFGEKEIRYRVHRVGANGKGEFKWQGVVAPDDWEQWIQGTPGLGAGEYHISATAPNGMARIVTVVVGSPVGELNNPMGSGSNDSYVIKELFRRIDGLESRLTSPVASTPIGELVLAMKGLQEMSGGGGLGGVEKMADLFKLGIEVGQSGAGKSGSALEIITDAAKEVLKPAVPALMGMLASKTGSPNNEVAVVPQEQKLEAAMKAGIQWLKKQKMVGVDPQALLHLLEANAAEYEPFIRFALDQEFDAFAQLDPEIKSPTYEPFFRSLYDGLRSDFKEANSVDAHSSGPGGNTANPSSNGATGKRRK